MIEIKDESFILLKQPLIVLSIFGELACSMVILMLQTYTTLIVTDIYKELNLNEQEGKTYLSRILMTSNLLCLAFAVIFGHCEKYINLRHFLLLNNLLIFIALFFFF